MSSTTDDYLTTPSRPLLFEGIGRAITGWLAHLCIIAQKRHIFVSGCYIETKHNSRKCQDL